MSESVSQPHERAFAAFAERARDALGESIHELLLFGSAARGEARGIDSDADVFVVLDSTDDEDELRDIAYEVQLEYGIVVSLHVKSKGRFEERKDHPFVKNVLRDGRSYDWVRRRGVRCRHEFAGVARFVRSRPGTLRRA
jgi:predicted nucleotidyltransferase